MLARLYTFGTRVRSGSPVRRGALFYMLFWGAAGVYDPFLSVYFSRLGLSGRDIGLLMALVPLATLLMSPLVSFVADRARSRVRLLSLCLLATVPAFIGLFLADDFRGALVGMALFALFRGPVEPLADSLVARMAVTHRFAYGRARLWGSLSFASVALLFGFLWERFGYGPMLLVAALFALPAALAALLLTEQTEATEARQPLQKLLRDPVIVTLTLCSFLAGGALVMNETFAGVYMDELGGGAFLVGAIWAVTALAELPTMHYADALVARFSGPRALAAAYALMGLSFLGYAFIHNPAWLLSLSLLKGLGFGLFFVATVRTVDARTPPEWSATALSVVFGVATLGLARLLGSGLAGFLYDLSPQVLFLSCTALAFAAVGILLGARLIFEPLKN